VSDQPYLNLIDQLLACPNGTELAIIRANLHLMDERWRELTLSRADQLTAQGQPEQAQFLQQVSNLWQNLNRPDEQPNFVLPPKQPDYLQEISELQNILQRMEAAGPTVAISDRPYQDFIDQLLNCPNGEELAMFRANLHLIDDRWHQLVLQRMDQLKTKGEQAQVDYLGRLLKLWKNLNRLESDV